MLSLRLGRWCASCLTVCRDPRRPTKRSMKISRALRAALRVVVCLHLGNASVGFAATDWSPATLLTQPFNTSVSKIQITPGSRWGLFRESDSISIQTTDDSAIQIFDLNGNSVYSGA